ncbi:flavin reductase family protein [Brevibacterium linens]|uniref:NADH-FMN oxidoreductase RutF, flavin reductase (DIM6/NTAB) family n=1 Tax=Brevibacterium linens ATCC 9172 TaxID=1255617 RepID=A0A2H1KBG5_BRELN|nr:flavin reductase family protein [Brevibacterium linens]KAB1946100.1 flavin reductase [Brevibacterium linens ATCC 9172]SMX97026.1 NADH-FMN oxidoreductase RutF, flavin reductase (DIM6/NTAB) family [Brevibacterium linens ATCC 9172]
MNTSGLDDLMGSVDSPLIVVTTSAEGERAGCLVGFHSQASIDPEHYCFWLSKANHTYRVALRSERFAVHFLTDVDRESARHFGSLSGMGTDKFAGLDFTVTEDGVPLLADLPNRLIVERIAMLDDGSDHVCLTARVLATEAEGGFASLRPSQLGDLSPGHSAEERAIRP